MSARLGRRTLLAGLAAMSTLAAVGVPVAPAAAEREPVTTTEVTFVGGGDVILHGIVVAPRPSGNRRPALVMLEERGTAAGKSSNRRRRCSPGPARRHHGHLRQTEGRLQPLAARLRLARRRRCRGGGTVGDPTRRRPISPRIVGPIGRSLRRPARLPSVECGQVRDHSRRGRGDSSGADLVGLRPVPPPRRRRRRATTHPGDHRASDDDQCWSLPRGQLRPDSSWQQVRQPVLAEWGEFDRVALPGRAARPSRKH